MSQVPSTRKYMEVRWRLFARDIVSMAAGDDGEFLFGRPPRPVRGLRFFGAVVHRSRAASLLDETGAAAVEQGAGRGFPAGHTVGNTDGGCDGSGGGKVDLEFGLLGVGERRGVHSSSKTQSIKIR